MNYWRTILFFVLASVTGFQAFALTTNSQQKETDVFILDRSNYLSNEDEQSLTEALISFQKESHLAVFLVISDEWPQPLDTRSIKYVSDIFHTPRVKEKVLIVIDSKQKQSLLRVKSEKFFIPQTIIDNLNRQFIVANLNATQSLAFTDAMAASFVALGKLVDRHKAIRINQKQQEKISWARFKWVSWFFIGSAVIFLAIWGIKSQQHGKEYERTIFYPLSRISETLGGIITLTLLLTVAYSLFGFIFFYDELIWSYVFLLVGMVPMATFTFHIGFVVKDYFLAKKLHASRPSKPEQCGIVPLYLLTYPSTTPSVLLEKTFFSLVMSKAILIEYESKQFGDGREKIYTRVAPGPNFNLEQCKAYERPFLEPLKNMPSGYSFYFKSFIVAVNKGLIGLKFFEKDLVSTELIKAGLIKKNLWLFNKYKPTEKGHELVFELQRSLKILNDRISTWHLESNDDLSFLGTIKNEILLLSNFKRTLQDLKDRIEYISTEHQKNMVLSPLLSKNLGLNEFEDMLESIRTVRRASPWDEEY